MLYKILHIAFDFQTIIKLKESYEVFTFYILGAFIQDLKIPMQIIFNQFSKDLQNIFTAFKQDRRSLFHNIFSF